MRNFTLRLYLHLSKYFLGHWEDGMTRNCLSIFSLSQKNPNQDTLKRRKRKKVPKLMLVNISNPNCIEVYSFTQNLSLQVIVHEFLAGWMKSKRMSKWSHHHNSCRTQSLNGKELWYGVTLTPTGLCPTAKILSRMGRCDAESSSPSI